MERLLGHLSERETLANAVATAVLFVALMGARMVMRRFLRSSALPVETRRKWLVRGRNTSIVAFLFFGGIIWATEIRTVALSAVAVAAALVIGTKELILCLLGSIVRGASNAFEVGDRIEVAHVRGDVIDISVWATTLLEVGPGHASHKKTGRTIVVPNSVYLNQLVTNESYTEAFVLHTFVVPLKISDDRERAVGILMAAASDACSEHRAEVERHFTRLGERLSIDMPDPAPQVTLQLPEPDRVNLMVRIPAPARDKGRIEQVILRRFLAEFEFAQSEKPCALLSRSPSEGAPPQPPSAGLAKAP